jgi:hypothetical protein
MRTIRIVALGMLALATVAAVAWQGLEHNSVRADSTLVVGIDMDPYNTPANTCPNDGVTDCTIGSVETCKHVDNVAGTTFDVDVFVTALTNGFHQWSANIEFPDPSTAADLTLSSHIAEIDAGVNLIMQSGGSAPFSSSESAPDPPGSTDQGSPHHASAADIGTAEGPGFTQGVLGRYEFTVDYEADGVGTPGYYSLTLPPPFVGLTDQFAVLYTVDEIWDYDFTPQYGIIALGVPCPASAAPVGGVAELPDVSGSTGPNYIALAALATVAVAALTAAACYARRRWLR